VTSLFFPRHSPAIIVMEKPMSVEQIVKLASEPFFDTNYPMLSWFRTANLMVKQAEIYEREGNLSMAYFLLYRHAILMLNFLPTHPQTKDPQYQKLWLQAKKQVKRDLAKLELLKPSINEKYETYVASVEARDKSARLQHEDMFDGLDSSFDAPLHARRRSSTSTQAVDPHRHQDLAVKLANLEVHRRKRRTVPDETTGDLNAQLVQIRKQIDKASRSHVAEEDEAVAVSHQYDYPDVPEWQQDGSSVESAHIAKHRPLQPSAPQRPPKEFSTSSHTLSGPPLPRKEREVNAPDSLHQFASKASLESGQNLRTLFLPAPLRYSFLKIAAANTRANLETCGILAGTLVQNALFVTKLIIPEQTATSDTCEMVDELALFEYTETQADDIVLGWIHTHPSQTCFLSSRDLHTHFPYQGTLAEAIAIVCAPAHQPDYGVFRLTDPPGLQAIRNCRQSATFHPHSESNIYTDADSKQGHVIEHDALKFEVVDLRPKR
jgi:STAM-binding protein